MLDFIKAYGVAENPVVTLVAINSALSGCNLCFKFRFGHFNPQLVRNSCDRQGLNIGSHTTIRGTLLSAATCTFFFIFLDPLDASHLSLPLPVFLWLLVSASSFWPELSPRTFIDTDKCAQSMAKR